MKEKSLFGMKLFLQGIKKEKQLIGFDIGTHSTGIAISSPDLKTAHLLKVITGDLAQEKTLDKMIRIIKSRKTVQGLVFGTIDEKQYPGSKMKQVVSQTVERMSQKNVDLPYVLVDEAYSTSEAKTVLITLQQAYRQWGNLFQEKDLRDGLAAMNILNRFLIYYNK